MLNNKTLGSANVGLIIGLVVIIIIGVFIYNQSKAPSDLTAADGDSMPMVENSDESMDTMDATDGDTMNADKEEETMEKDMNTSDATMGNEPGPVVQQVGKYADYSPETLASVGDGRTVLFFHAGWCPSCRALEKNVENNLSAIPSDVTILVVNYDKETDLKKKYGVTRQHTLVQVDADGNKVKTLTGLTNTLDQVVAQL